MAGLIRATTNGGGDLFSPLTSGVQTWRRTRGDINTDNSTPKLRTLTSRDNKSSPNGQQREVETVGVGGN